MSEKQPKNNAESKSISEAIFALFMIVLLGGIGGFVAFSYRSWMAGVPFDRATMGDPVSIANTYIVFTTFIVAVAAIVVTVVSINLSSQISKSKITQSKEAFESLKELLARDEIQAIGLIDALLDNPEVKRHLTTILEEAAHEKIRDLAQSTTDNAVTRMSEAQASMKEAKAASLLAEKIRQKQRDNSAVGFTFEENRRQ